MARPSEASCPQSRRFAGGRPCIPLGSGEQFLGSGSFWAPGQGLPAPGFGIDNGTYSANRYAVPTWIGTYPDNIDGDWNAAGVDGCIDLAGATPNLDGDECMLLLVASELDPYYNYSPPDFGHYMILSRFAHPAVDPVFDFTDARNLLGRTVMAPIPSPTIEAMSTTGDEVMVTVGAGMTLPPWGSTSIRPAAAASCSAIV